LGLGEPRATMDIDVVVDIPVEAIPRLSKELGERDMLVPEDIILEAIIEDRSDNPINAIHMYSGYKVGLYPLPPRDELRKSAFLRRKRIDLGPEIGLVYLHSPEDLIIYKIMDYSLPSRPNICEILAPLCVL